MKKLTAAAVAILAVAVLVSTAQADRIVTYSGKALVGKIVQEEPDKVVIKTDTDTVTVPRVTIKSLEKGPGDKAAPEKGTETGPAPKAPSAIEKPQAIVPVEVEAQDLEKARAAAKAAVATGEWAKAGGYLEGITKLDTTALPPDERLAALAALATCYLQCKDAAGAARTFGRRAGTVADANEKKRMMAAAEMLKATGSVTVLGKSLGRYDEAIEEGLAWKAEQGVAQAKQAAAKATELNVREKLEKAATTCQDKLREADGYVPGTFDKNRETVLAFLVQNIMDAAKQFVESGTETRKELSRTRLASVTSVARAQAWNGVAAPYLAKRKAAEDALKGLQAFTEKFEIPSLYQADAVRKLLTDLDDLAYFPSDTPRGYGYLGYNSEERIRIDLRRF
jgi:hypothetical protein